MFKKVPSARSKADEDLEPLAKAPAGYLDTVMLKFYSLQVWAAYSFN